jgi:hypothetical protein
MGGMNQKRPTAIKGTMNHADASFSTEICAGAIISVVQYLAPLRFSLWETLSGRCRSSIYRHIRSWARKTPGIL